MCNVPNKNVHNFTVYPHFFSSADKQKQKRVQN